MGEEKLIRLSQAARKLNVGHNSILDFLGKKGYEIENNPNSKLTRDQFDLLVNQFGGNSKNVLFVDVPKPTGQVFKGPIPPKVTLIGNRDSSGRRPRKHTSTQGEISASVPNYKKGEIVKGKIASKIHPSQIIVTLSGGCIGRISAMDLAWSFPEAELKFQMCKVGDEVSCEVLHVVNDGKTLTLSQKKTTPPFSDSIRWQRIERGDEFNAFVVELLNDNAIVRTQDGLYGIISKAFLSEGNNEVHVRVHSKLDSCDLLVFIPASSEVDEEPVESNSHSEPSFIDEDLISYYAFNKSLLGTSATDEQHELIKSAFEIDPKIFAKELASPYTLYIQFERNSSAYEQSFLQNGISYFFDGANHTPELEKQLLLRLGNLHYWFRINQRPDRGSNELLTEFSLFNEEVNFYGEVTASKDLKEYRFAIRNFSIGQTNAVATEGKKRNAKLGSFLFANPLVILGPLNALPIGHQQKNLLNYVLLKVQCFETVAELKKSSGEILRHEGRTLAIIDKFLEYQIHSVEERKEANIFVSSFEQVHGHSDGVTIRVSARVAESLDIEDEAMVILRLKKQSLKIDTQDELVFFKNAKAVSAGSYLELSFQGDVNLALLQNGFYVDKRSSKSQLEVQQEIVQDFLSKKIKIDHIESLLTQPEKVKTPVLARVQFRSPDLAEVETSQPDNNQTKAVRKAVGNKNIFLIQGPPGTGKTTVIAEVIEQLAAKGERILVAGQNHVAVDNVLKKISKLKHLNLLRVGNSEKVDNDLRGYTIDNLVDGYRNDLMAFLLNQIELTKQFVALKASGSDDAKVKESFNRLTNEVSQKYEKLKPIFRSRHFNFWSTLQQLSFTEVEKFVDIMSNFIMSIETGFELLLKPLIYNSVDVTFSTCIGIKTDSVFRNANFKFDTVIIDEAGKANIAETLVAIELGKRVILVGDQMQLPPYFDSSLLDESEPKSFPNSPFGSEFSKDEIVHALKTSFFEFLINRIKADKFPKANLEMLNYQHRMHPHIGEFVSESFYGGSVNMGAKTLLNKRHLPAPFDQEVIFFDTSNSIDPFERVYGTSIRNDVEAQSISEVILPRLFQFNVDPKEIAIITPYKSQVENIKRHINVSSVCNFKNIDISTLDSFQGKEYNIIIFSFTRSANHRLPKIINGRRKFTKVGFLDDARRLNVAFSRAIQKLILIGNSVTLTDARSHYDGLFDYTGLFKKLVEKSKDEKIGRFINIADHHSFKGPWDRFVEKYELGSTVTGTIKTIGRKNNLVFGIFVTIDSVDSLLPWSLMSEDLKRQIEALKVGAPIKVVIDKIDALQKQVTVKVPDDKATNSNESLSTLKIEDIRCGDVFLGVVNSKTEFGCSVKLQGGPLALLHKSQVPDLDLVEKGQLIKVRVINIDKRTKQIEVSI
jgi:predicted RNA-binding protein with RPS1 domain